MLNHLIQQDIEPVQLIGSPLSAEINLYGAKRKVQPKQVVTPSPGTEVALWRHVMVEDKIRVRPTDLVLLRAQSRALKSGSCQIGSSPEKQRRTGSRWESRA